MTTETAERAYVLLHLSISFVTAIVWFYFDILYQVSCQIQLYYPNEAPGTSWHRKRRTTTLHLYWVIAYN
jgi:hypothetical protein